MLIPLPPPEDREALMAAEFESRLDDESAPAAGGDGGQPPPREYVDAASWPRTCSVPCYNCTAHFDTPPAALLEQWYRGASPVTGVFCSWACARGFCMRNHPYLQARKLWLNTLHLRDALEGPGGGPVPAAPPHWVRPPYSEPPAGAPAGWLDCPPVVILDPAHE